MSATPERIKELRQATGAGFLECRKALEETGGDIDKAAVLLRERGMAKAAKRSGRETSAGVLDLYSHGEGQVGVMVEVNCETDFVARTDAFRTFAHEIALQIAAASPRWMKIEDVPEDVVAGERQIASKLALSEGKPENIVERIVDGRMKKFYEDNCLYEQAYIRDDSKSIADLVQETISSTGENINIRRFARWKMGESLD